MWNKLIFSLLEKNPQFTILIQVDRRFFIEGQHAGPSLFTFTLHIWVNDQFKTDTKEWTPSAIDCSNLIISFYISWQCKSWMLIDREQDLTCKSFSSFSRSGISSLFLWLKQTDSWDSNLITHTKCSTALKKCYKKWIFFCISGRTGPYYTLKKCKNSYEKNSYDIPLASSRNTARGILFIWSLKKNRIL